MTTKGFVIVDSKGKRIRNLEGELTPFFQFPEGAIRYIVKRLGNSPGARIKTIKVKNGQQTTNKE